MRLVVKTVGCVLVGKMVHPCLGVFLAAQLLLARKGYQGIVGQSVAADDVADGLIVEYGTLYVLAHHHCLALASKLVRTIDIGVEMVDHYLCLGLDGLRIALHALAYLLLCLLVVVDRILLHALHHLVVALIGGVVA